MSTDNPWRLASDTLPPTDTLVEVCGKSGMGRNRHFLAYGQYMPECRPLHPWRDIMLDALSDYGWTPLYWRFPEPLPDMPE